MLRFPHLCLERRKMVDSEKLAICRRHALLIGKDIRYHQRPGEKVKLPPKIVDRIVVGAKIDARSHQDGMSFSPYGEKVILNLEKIRRLEER